MGPYDPWEPKVPTRIYSSTQIGHARRPNQAA